METLTVDKTQQKMKQEPILVPPGGGEKLNIAGSPIFHKVKSRDTDGVFSVMEFVTAPGKGVALHVHEREDELVYLLEAPPVPPAVSLPCLHCCRIRTSSSLSPLLASTVSTFPTPGA